jgi:hypothetical protein
MTDAWLTDAEMVDISGDLIGGRPDTCVVTRPAATINGSGLPNNASPAAVGTFDCRVEQPAPGRPFPGIPEGSSVDRVIAFLLGRAVQNADQIAVNGETYDVLDTNISSTFKLEHVTLCQKVTT